MEKKIFVSTNELIKMKCLHVLVGYSQEQGHHLKQQETNASSGDAWKSVELKMEDEASRERESLNLNPLFFF